ncbi:MAG TPA: NTF2-like N-terminal transpeptidase domain-containing protein, partial [Mycobacterium sp.]
MATKITVASAATFGVVVLLTTSAVSACTPRPEGPAPAAERFFAALATGDTAAAAELSDNPSDAREALNAAWAGLQATHLDTQV